MYRARNVFGSFQLALDERFVDDHLRCDIREFTFLPRFYLLSHRLKLRCIRSTPTEMQSMSEKDFECLANTGVSAPATMFPNSAPKAYGRRAVERWHSVAECRRALALSAISRGTEFLTCRRGRFRVWDRRADSL
jgi:hypothetical protein